MQLEPGLTISAPGYSGKIRNWTVVAAYYESENEGLVVADPHFTDDERVTVEKVTKINEARKTVLPTGVALCRAVLEIADVRIA